MSTNSITPRDGASLELHTPAASPPGLAIIDWRPLARNSLLGFVAVRLKNGLTIRDITVLRTGEKLWCGLPSKPIVGADGVAHKDAKGKTKYSPILEWPNRATSDRFNEAVITALRLAHPDAL